MFRLDKAHKVRGPRSAARARTHLSLEVLESRVVPYALSGDIWPHPALVTVSFVPDGTIVGSTQSGPIYSNLFATMNARFGTPAVWENQILAAAQTWAAQTNVNFELVADNGTPIGQGAYQQGDPHMGDVRIGAYNLGPNLLAQTYMPPPDSNYSIVGDMEFNSAATWNIGSTFDLYTVATHEFGHVVSLGESGVSTAVMWPYYTGAVSGLSADDITGVQAAYSGGAGRTPDIIDQYYPNNTWQTSYNLTSYLSAPNNTVLLANMDITTTSDVDWYMVQAPTGTTSTPQILVQSYLQSLLRPQVQVFSGGNLIASAAVGAPLGGSLLYANLSGITAGQWLYIEVSGVTANAYGTGKYAFAVNFGTGPTPSMGAAATATLDGNPLVTGGVEAMEVPMAGAPTTVTAPRPTSIAPAVAVVLQARQGAPASGNGVLPSPAVLASSPLAVPPAAAALLPASLPTATASAGQPGPTLAESRAADVEADDVSADPPASPGTPAVPVTVPGQPQQVSRAFPASASTWSRASTAFFAAESGGFDQAPVTRENISSGIAPEAAVALAGIVAVAGETRISSQADTDEERKRRRRG